MIRENIRRIRGEIGETELIVVSKTRSLTELNEVYECGERHFAENRVQALLERIDQLPDDIHWHLIGHLQTNKVRSVLPHVVLIHSVDSFKLLDAIEKESQRLGKRTSVLLQTKVATDDSKFGFDPKELLNQVLEGALRQYKWISFRGVMSMTTLDADQIQKANEFKQTKEWMDKLRPLVPEPDQFQICSMGMSDDYLLAIEQGSTHVRIGSRLFQ